MLKVCLVMCKYIFVSLLIKNPSVTIPEFHLLLYITLYILHYRYE